MEQVKITLGVLKKHHFWVLVGLVAVLGLATYITAASSLQGQYTTRAGSLKTAWESANKITLQSDHPNDKKIARLENLKRQQDDKVKEAWWLLYKQQKESNPWPAILGEKFLSLKEILDDPTKEIPRPFPALYRNNIEKALPKLLEIVNFRQWVPVVPEEGAAAAPPAGETPAMQPPGMPGNPAGLPGQQQMKQVGTVDWNPADKGRVEAEFNFGNVIPTSRQVRLTQENYWVYKALLTIVRKTNGDATTHAGAAIKEIIALEIGKNAAAALGGRGNFLGAAAAGATGVPGAMSEGGPAPMAAPVVGGGPNMEIGPVAAPTDPTAMGGGAPTAATGDAALLANRYVDDKMKPLASGEPFYPEFNMMPVHLVLVIDQRRIPDLLVECAKSTMPVEVVEMRISRGKIEAVAAGMGMGGMGMGGMGMGGEMGEMPHGGGTDPAGGVVGPGAMGMGTVGGGMGMGAMPAGEIPGGMGQFGAEDEEASPYEVYVEIFGIIYIYNPPKEASQQAVDGTTDAAGAAPASESAPSPPAAPPVAPAP